MDPSTDEFLNRLAQAAESCRSSFLAMGRSHRWQPQAGSPAAAVAKVADAMDQSRNADSIASGFLLISEVVVSYLEVAASQLARIAALLRAREAMFPPIPLIRGVLEYASHATWVIGEGTDLNGETLARAYLEEFTSCEYQKLAAGKLSDKSDTSYQAVASRWKAVRERILVLYPGTRADDVSESKPGRHIGDQRLPGPEAGVLWMFDLMERLGGGTVTLRQAEGIYALLSQRYPSIPIPSQATPEIPSRRKWLRGDNSRTRLQDVGEDSGARRSDLLLRPDVCNVVLRIPEGRSGRTRGNYRRMPTWLSEIARWVVSTPEEDSPEVASSCA